MNVSYDPGLGNEWLATQLKKMKRSWKTDLMTQINRAEHAIHEFSHEKGRGKGSAFADVSSILIGPGDVDDQMKVVSDDDGEDFNQILEKDNDDSIDESIGPVHKVTEENDSPDRLKIKIRIKDTPKVKIDL